MSDFFDKLMTQGWSELQDVADANELLHHARQLGTILKAPDGSIVRTLQVRSQGRRGTLSAAHGVDAFPLHTDTAFWKIPARYLVMRVSGDLRRKTTLLRFRDALSRQGLEKKAHTSIWQCKREFRYVYSPMTIPYDRGFRYDPLIMRPANEAAQDVREFFHGAAASLIHEHNWKVNEAIVIDNWLVLHGRGARPIGEGERLLERVYVGEAK